MSDLHTDEKLLAALKEAATRTISRAEAQKQRVSFIMGSVDDESGVTRERVEKALADAV